MPVQAAKGHTGAQAIVLLVPTFSFHRGSAASESSSKCPPYCLISLEHGTGSRLLQPMHLNTHARHRADRPLRRATNNSRKRSSCAQDMARSLGGRLVASDAFESR